MCASGSHSLAVPTQARRLTALNLSPLRETSTNTSVLPTAIRQEARRYAQLREDKTVRENTSGHHVCV